MNQNYFSLTVKELRKQRALTQEQAAEALSVSVQAVSKWECGQSYPDLETLVRLADFYGVSMDSLLRETPDRPTGELRQLPADGVLHVVQVLNGHILSDHEYDPHQAIPLCIPEGAKGFEMDIRGSAKIKGEVNGTVSAGGNIACGNISGDASAGGNLECGGNIDGDASAGNALKCGNIGGDASAGGAIVCNGINGKATGTTVEIG